MDADIQGCLNQINKSWKAFEHNNKRMTKIEVKTILEYGLKKGYEVVSEIPEKDIDDILKRLAINKPIKDKHPTLF